MTEPSNRSNRRQFLKSLGAGTFLGTGAISAGGPLIRSVPAAETVLGRRPKVAFLGTVVYRHSHAQHFLDRHTVGYTWNGGWQRPRVDVVSVYIDQFPENDLARGRIRKHGLNQVPTIEEALTLGGEKLAVDGVIIIGEHGSYPRTEKGQTRYPRYEWFKKVVDVFEDSGRSVPVFNDKHLSTDWDECVEMVEDSRRLNFPFLAGSSLPVTRRMPCIDMPYGAAVKESVCVAYGGVDSYDIHALETAQCMSERRAGGETGVRQIHALRGDNLWKRLWEDDCRTTRQLIVSALTRSHNLPVETGFPTDATSIEWLQKMLKLPREDGGARPESLGYIVEHNDGLRTTMLLTDIRDFNYAGMLEDGSIVSCQMYLPMPGHGSTTADFFNPLARHAETTIIEGRTPYPIERTLLTSGMVIGGLDSLIAGEVPVPTPHLNVEYTGSQQSTFWQS
ncbi:MAG: hypothetical protein MK110_05560 [Fuerstiella sp.]|nr:hypothetical protein [Fuerstiella sp.]